MKKIYFIAGLLFFFAFLQCSSEQKDSKNVRKSSEEEVIAKGRMIAQTTFSTLSSALKTSLEVGGIDSAITYCNLAAMPLTDSLSQVYSADIKRVSERYRNPKNKPSKEEAKAIQKFEEALDEKQTLKPIVKDIDGSQVFFAPIMMQELCLNCHGNKENITNYPLIKEHYPEDLAVGYSLGELRGMWSITFNKI